MATETSTPTVTQHHVVHERESGSAMAGAIALLIIALLLIAGFALYAMGYFPFNMQQSESDVQIDLPVIEAPGTTNPN